jgi:hypothetical protein
MARDIGFNIFQPSIEKEALMFDVRIVMVRPVLKAAVLTAEARVIFPVDAIGVAPAS